MSRPHTGARDARRSTQHGVPVSGSRASDEGKGHGANALQKAERDQRASAIAAKMAEDREEKREDMRRQRIVALDAKLTKLRQALRQRQNEDLSEMGARIKEQVEETRAKMRALEQEIEDETNLLRSPNWLKSVHDQRRRDALAALAGAQGKEGSPEQLAAAAELDAMMAHTSVEDVSEEDVWTGSNEEIAEAQDTILRLEKNVQRLTERLQTPFLTDATKVSIESKISNSQEIKEKLQTRIDTTMKERFAESIRHLHELPARPSSSWVSLQLLKQQHGHLLERLHPLLGSKLPEAKAIWNALIARHKLGSQDDNRESLPLRDVRFCLIELGYCDGIVDNAIVNHKCESSISFDDFAQLLGLCANASFKAELEQHSRSLLEHRLEIFYQTYAPKIKPPRSRIQQIARDFVNRMEVLNEGLYAKYGACLDNLEDSTQHVVEDDFPLLLNQRVRIRGLDADDSYLNGQMGTVRKFDGATSTCGVSLDNFPEEMFLLPVTSMEARGLAHEFKGDSVPRPATSWSDIKSKVHFDIADQHHGLRGPLLRRKLETAGDFRRRTESKCSRSLDATRGKHGNDMNAGTALKDRAEIDGGDDRRVLQADIWPPSLPTSRWTEREIQMQNASINPRVAAIVFKDALKQTPSKTSWAALRRRAGTEAGCPDAGRGRAFTTEFVLHTHHRRARRFVHAHKGNSKHATWTALVDLRFRYHKTDASQAVDLRATL